jgi:hypothetical protein
LKHPLNRLNESQLREKAEKLLKGCEMHFRRCVIRVSNISGVVHPRQKHEFRRRAFSLLKFASIEEYQHQIDFLVAHFPKTKSFFQWWTSREHAQMLFPIKYANHKLFKKLPNMTNAQESMHFKMYRACADMSKPLNFGLMDGLTAAVSFCDGMERRFVAATSEFPSFNSV